MKPARDHRGVWRDVALTLAAFALALQVFVPSGFMVSSQNGRGVIVICTGHGPLTVATADGKTPAAPVKKKSDAPCAFAGHAAPYTAPLAAPASGPAVAVVREVAARPLESLTPGRGLAAPPPPSRGPPSLLI